MSFILVILYLGLVIIRPQEYLSVLSGIPILKYVLLAAIVSNIFRQRNTTPPAHYFLLPALLGVMMLSHVAHGWVGGAFYVLENFSSSFLVFYLVAASADSIQRVRVLMKVMVICAMILALHGIQQANTGVGWTGATMEKGRIIYVGIFSDPNDLGLFFLVVVPMLPHLYSISRNTLWRIFLICTFVCVLYACYLTQSRGTVLALGVLLFVHSWRRLGPTKTIVYACLFSPLAIPLVSSRLSESGVTDDSAVGRLDAWQAGFAMFKASPIYGIGYRSFTDYHGLTAHNCFVLVFAELGFVGYYLWFSFIALTAYGLYRVSTLSPVTNEGGTVESASETEAARQIGSVILYSLAAFFVSGSFLSRSYIVVLYLLCALGIAHYQNTRIQVSQLPSLALADRAVMLLFLAGSSMVGLYLFLKVMFVFV